MGGFRSDVERLAQRAGEFDDVAVHAQRIADALRRAVEDTGACWGDDEFGTRFAATHRPQADEALAALGRLPGELRGFGEDLAAAADTTRRADTAGADALRRLAGEG
ncbi:hypothetical protein EIL87_24040 [Saccharopolyspora rhizosphaerae]|uniref:WXG100 family type VII secretion target n=2 Tax=Saccharopolyspora rhizosphaerae TaxID=2492662 RepID=A0A3R8NZJ2_9PSEU|nr:hypothetical protein [Saccharopolyspora rhizosphaerae]RRO13242.1 hypothetical protein EIL87_24040 [Saccharopolyspora rhizosphaerae]